MTLALLISIHVYAILELLMHACCKRAWEAGYHEADIREHEAWKACVDALNKKIAILNKDYEGVRACMENWKGCVDTLRAQLAKWKPLRDPISGRFI